MHTDRETVQPSVSPFTLLAVTALAVSNLLVGILQGNSFLIAASSVISAAFAFVYAVRSGMLPANWLPGVWPKDGISDATGPRASTRSRFPLWMFLGLIFVVMPTVLLFLQSTAP